MAKSTKKTKKANPPTPAQGPKSSDHADQETTMAKDNKPGDVQGALVHMLWGSWWGRSLLVLFGCGLVALAIWSTLPDDQKNAIISWLRGMEEESSKQQHNIGTMLAQLPPNQQDNFERQARAKAGPPTLSELKVTELVTLFFEVPLTELKNPQPWDEQDKKVLPGFLKIQVVSYEPTAMGDTRIKALYSSSADSCDSCHQEVYRLSPDGELSDVATDGDPDGGVFKASLRPGDQVVIIVTYDGWLLNGPLGQPELNWRRDWHMVEVSDFASHGPVSYLFATGSKNYSLTNLKAYNFWKDKQEQIAFEQHSPAAPKAFAFLLQSKLLPVIKAIKQKGEFKTPHSAALDFLASSVPGQGFASVSWDGEESDEQSQDTAYITQTKGEKRP